MPLIPGRRTSNIRQSELQGGLISGTLPLKRILDLHTDGPNQPIQRLPDRNIIIDY